MVYFPFAPITYVSRFILGIHRREDELITKDMLKEWGIVRPNNIFNAFKSLNLISEKNKLTDLGKDFLIHSTRKQAARIVLDSPYYYEIVSFLKDGTYDSKAGPREYIEGITGWKKDATDKAIALLAYFLRYAELKELMEIDFIKKAQITPRKGTRKGTKNINRENEGC